MPRKHTTDFATRLYLTVPEVQAWTGLSRPFIRKLIDDGTFRHVRDGQRIKVLTRSIAEYITAHAQPEDKAS